MITRLEANNPDPHCELYYETPFQLLVSVVLSAQTTDKMVNRCMVPVYQSKNPPFTPDTVVSLGEKGLLELIRPIGLAPTKAKNVTNLSRILINQFGGCVPDNRSDLESLPGVGRKTASVILGELFHEPTLAVDTHVFRVTNRLGLQNEKTPEKAESELLKIIDPKFLPKAHHWFILLGRYTCKAQKPDCARCPLNELCPAWRKIKSGK